MSIALLSLPEQVEQRERRFYRLVHFLTIGRGIVVGVHHYSRTVLAYIFAVHRRSISAIISHPTESHWRLRSRSQEPVSLRPTATAPSLQRSPQRSTATDFSSCPVLRPHPIQLTSL